MLPRPLYHLAVEIILPIATLWVAHGENRAKKFGRPLSTKEAADAKSLGIQSSECIRILEVQSIFPWEKYTRGVSYRYGILIRKDSLEDRSIVFHECVHTTQYERLGGIRPFLRAYLRECLIEKYPNGKLEQEAIIKTAKQFG